MTPNLVMFLDESGNHGLTTIDPDYPVFVLGGVLLDKTYAETVVMERLQSLKIELFGNPDLILHTADITRNRNGFESMKSPAVREHFYSRLNAIMRDLEYKVVACVIR